MIGLFIMVIVTLSLVAGASASVFFVLSSAQSTLALQQNQVRIQAISDALKSRFTIIDGRLTFPLGGMEGNLDTGTNSYMARVPTDLVFTKTSTGQPITFCPVIYEQAGAFTASQKLELDSSTPLYDLDIRNNGIVGAMPSFRALNSGEGAGYSQLDAQSLNKSGIYGFLISPDPQVKNGALFNCNDVVKYSANAAETFLINQGTVFPVFANNSTALTSNYIVTPSGSGINADGQQIVHSISDALALIGRNGQVSATILLQASTDLSAQDLAALSSQVGSRSLVMTPSTGSMSIVKPASGIGNNLVLNGNTTFKNIDLSAFNLTAPVGSTITLDASIGGGMTVTGGTVSITNGSTLSAPAGLEAAVNVKSGQVNVNTAANPAIGMAGGGASFMIYGGAVSIQADLELASGMTIYPDPTVSASGIPSKPINLIDNHTVNGIVSGAHQIGLTEFTSQSRKATSTTTSTCSEQGCTIVASCPANLKAVTGDCATTDEYPLASSAIVNQGHSYVCEWASYVPVQNYNPQSPAYRTPQGPSASVSCVNP